MTNCSVYYANLFKYNPAVREFRLTSQGPVGIGTTGVTTAQFLGRRFDVGVEMVDYKANEMAVTRSTSGPVDVEIVTTAQSTPEGTRLTQHWSGETHGFFKLAEPVITRVTRKQMQTALDTLQELLEAEASTS